MTKKIILASNSPRRKELLSGLGFDFEVRVLKGVDESYPEDLEACKVPEYIAREKARAYSIGDDEIVITADTVVVVDDVILGKPHNRDEAHRMLRMISGRKHSVVTGVCLSTNVEQRCLSVKTDVEFKQLSDDEIYYYIDNYRPYDKAGAYGIQEWIGYVGVMSITGSYFNVMGFPVQRVYEELTRHFGIELGKK